MKKTIQLSILATLCLFFEARAQQDNTRPLQHDDQLPSLTFSKLANTNARSISTDDHKDQLLIFDFWSTWCSSCIKMFEPVEHIQKQFKGKVQFIAVNSRGYDNEEKIKAFFSRHPEFSFASVWDDTVLTKLFPHHGIPYYVWIKHNKLLATTGPEAVHPDTIAAVLADNYRPGDLVTRVLDISKPIFYLGNGGEPAGYTYRSILIPYTPGFPSNISRGTDNNGKTSRMLFVNQTILNLYQLADNGLGQIAKNRIMTADGVDPGLLTDSASNSWKSKHLFTYEAIFPSRSLAAAQSLMQEDLRRYFGLSIDSATVERDCLIFSASSQQASGREVKRADAKSNWYTQELNIPIFFSNYPLTQVAQSLDEVSEIPVLNESEGDLRVDLRLTKPVANEQELRAALKKQGVTVTRAKRLVRMYIIRNTPESINLNHDSTR